MVTGGTGFIGSFVVEALVGAGAHVTVPTRNLATAHRHLRRSGNQVRFIECDLFSEKAAYEAISGHEILLNLAASVGGIEHNIAHPASMFRDNLMPFMNCMEAARKSGIERVLVTSSACVYPRFCKIPTPESEGFLDRPDPSNEGYGLSKRMQEYLGETYAKEFGMKVAIARPYNSYGPGDNFNPATSHVIPSLIRRIWKLKERPVSVWGSGKQTRSFLYVEDFARGLLEVAEKYAVNDVLNIGSDEETSIADLVGMLQEIYQELHGTKFEIFFDTSKPAGQPRRLCDTTKAFEKIGFRPQWQLKEGLRATVKWYLDANMPD